MTQTPPVASVDVPPSQPTVARQPVPGPQTGEPVIAPAPEGYPQQSQYAQPAVQYNEPLQQPVQPQQPYYAPAAEQPAQQPYYAPAAEQPVQQPYYALRQNNRWQVTPASRRAAIHFAPQSTYQTEQTYQQPAAQEPLYQQPQSVEQQPVVEPEPVVEETKPARPPLYYFEEVEEKRAREREQLAAVSTDSRTG